MHLQNAYSWEICKYIFSHFLFHAKSHGSTTDGNFLAYHYENGIVKHFEIAVRKRSLALWSFQELNTLRTREKKVLEHACPCGWHLKRKCHSANKYLPAPSGSPWKSLSCYFPSRDIRVRSICVQGTPKVKCSLDSPAVPSLFFSHSQKYIRMLGSENNGIWGLILNSF